MREERAGDPIGAGDVRRSESDSGRMVSVALRGVDGGRRRKTAREMKAGRARPRMHFPFVSFLCFLSFFKFFWRIWEEGEGGREGVPAGHQPDGPGTAGRLPVHTTRQCRGRERFHSQGPLEPSKSEVHADVPRQTKGGQGPEEILGREGSVLTAQLRAAAAIGRDGTAETQEWSETRYFSGRIIAEERAAAFQTASEWNRWDTVWTDGSRQDSGRAGAACVWRTQEGGVWTGRHYAG